jgi:hypothetical protein
LATSRFKHRLVFLTTPVLSLSFVYAHILERKPFTERCAMMILVRDVFQAKYGKGGELVALIVESGRREFYNIEG